MIINMLQAVLMMIMVMHGDDAGRWRWYWWLQ